MKLLLIDGYSLLYRAYFSSPPFSTKDGRPSGALFGFSKMIISLLDEMKPQYVLVALDAHGTTFRHDAYASYKAGRAEMQDDLRVQAHACREYLSGLSIPHYEHSGYEADDIIGTMSKIASDAGHEVTIVTGDGDALQLVDERVSAMLTRRGVSDLECYTPQAVRDRYQFDPPLITDYKGLRGDASDNIPGVPGIGEKTAIALISAWGNLDEIYQNLDNVTPPRIRDLLEKHREVAFHSRQLACIVRDLKMDIDLEFCRYDLSEEQRLKALETVRDYEFKSLVARYSQSSAPTDSSANTSDTSGMTPTGARGYAEPESQAREFGVETISDADVLQTWLDASDEPISTVYESETQSVVLGRGDEARIWSGELSALDGWLRDEKRAKIVHDSKAAKLALSARAHELNGVVADTLLMGYLLEPTRQQHPIAQLARKYLGRELPVEMDVPKPKKAPKTKVGASLFDADEAETEHEKALAAAKDQHLQVLAAQTIAMNDLRPVLCRELSQTAAQNLFDELELPLVDVLVSMQQSGMLLDRERLQKLGAGMEIDTTRLQGEIWNLAGREFNIGSTKQLQEVLFEDLKLARGRSIKTGFSTDVHTLEKLAEEHEVVRKILDYRGLTKLKSTYIDGLLNGMNAQTQRVHGSLNQTGTVSGRLSSSNPNLQNVPIRTAQGREIRRAFIAPPGWVILAADYSQIELRILAHITGDATLVEAFNTGQDVHARTAADLFHIPIAEVDSEMRRKAKMTNYAIAYGVSGFGLAKQLGSGTAGEAQEFIKRYFVTLPGVKKYIDDTMASARVDGFVETLKGRRRPLPEITSPRAVERAAAERTAINHPIQGTSADAMKLAMLAVQHELSERGLETRMTMQVHDELVFEVPEKEIEEVAELVGRLMREVPTKHLGLRVPLEVDVEWGPNWDETDSVDERADDSVDVGDLDLS